MNDYANAFRIGPIEDDGTLNFEVVDLYVFRRIMDRKQALTITRVKINFYAPNSDKELDVTTRTFIREEDEY